MAAEVGGSDQCPNNSTGIKLFGATIEVNVKGAKDEEEGEEGNKGEHQTAGEKRTDKIIPCPRCKSMETKFCYFNNYNVNQPRHFCKNCQRYWTAGGALRNVPVGAGRRKTKQPGHGLIAGLSDGCFFDDHPDVAAGVVQRFEFDHQQIHQLQLHHQHHHRNHGVVGEWHVAEEQGDFEHTFPAKRSRSTPSSTTNSQPACSSSSLSCS